MTDLVPLRAEGDQLARHVTAYLHTLTPGRINPVTTPARRDLIHWHGQPAALTEPPACCLHVFADMEDRAVRAAEHDAEQRELDERKRLILDSIASIEAYRDGMATVLTPEQMALAAKVADHCADLIRKAACICPDIDVSSIGQGKGTSFVKGLDARCGLHGRSVTP